MQVMTAEKRIKLRINDNALSSFPSARTLTLTSSKKDGQASKS